MYKFFRASLNHPQELEVLSFKQEKHSHQGKERAESGQNIEFRTIYTKIKRQQTRSGRFRFYLHRPVVAQLRLLLQFLLQIAVGFRLFGPHSRGPEATVVACGVTLEQSRALQRVHGHHQHTCRGGERRSDFYWSKSMDESVPEWREEHSQQPRGLISAFCVYTWEMSASRRHKASAVMS